MAVKTRYNSKHIFFYQTLKPPLLSVETHLLIPAQILFIVSAYRCFFPVSYATNAVLHDSFLSSIFFTRLLATLVEVAYIYQFSFIIRLFNQFQNPLIDILSWLMVIQVCISQWFVWCAILTGRFRFYFYEEVGWGIIFSLNTIANIILYLNRDLISSQELLIFINILFGFLYLPWQLFHLKSLRLRAINQEVIKNLHAPIVWSQIMRGLHKSIKLKIPTINSRDWGGVIGMTWMVAYWATIIPCWLYLIIRTI